MRTPESFAKVGHYHHRKFKEAIEIKKHMRNFNRDDCWKISKNWVPTLSSRFSSFWIIFRFHFSFLGPFLSFSVFFWFSSLLVLFWSILFSSFYCSFIVTFLISDINVVSLCVCIYIYIYIYMILDLSKF